MLPSFWSSWSATRTNATYWAKYSLLPDVFAPPFPGPLVWPGAQDVDVNMLSVPPNFPIPPVAAKHRDSPSMGAGPGHNIHLNQIGSGICAPTNVFRLSFHQLGTRHEMAHDKPPAGGGWTPHRNSGPIRKAPSGGGE
uniref:Uncharacterized protein n=1 Tax=Oryza brachyantha TaxID=4533 RepID=J3LK02_ORYBR